MAQLKGLEGTITDLATSLGVSSKSILSVGRISLSGWYSS